MISKLIKYLVVGTLITNKSFGAEEGGMPQLNPEYWVSQIFWLIVTFGSLYIILSQLILPKISKNLETRKAQVLNNIEQAEKFKKESEKKIKEYEEILSNARKQSKVIINEAKNKVNQDIILKNNELNKEIDKEIETTEEEIKLLKKNSINNINKIAIETSSNIIQNLINVEINRSNVSAIVEDISKKRIEKKL